MLIDSRHRRGIKLIELTIVVSIVALGFALLILPVQAAREAGRRTYCANNMRQIGLALINFSTSKNRFPNAGTFFDDPAVHQGDPSKSRIAQSILDPGAFAANPNSWLWNWVIDMLPYIDSQDGPFPWDHQKSYLSAAINAKTSMVNLSVLHCPDDPTTVLNQGNLSYVVNGGFSRWHAFPIGWDGGKVDGQAKNGGMLQWAAPGSDWRETQAVGRKLGVMFLGTHTGDQPWDIATGTNDIPDGSSLTLLLGENTLAGYSSGTRHSGGLPTSWACPLPNFCMFIASDDVCRTRRSATNCLAGSLTPTSQGRDGPGWGRANRPGTFENIGYGQNLSLEGSFPFANSGHPGGGNFVFCDGATRFLSSSIDGTVYAKPISPAGGQLPAPLLQGPLSPDVWDETP